MKNTILAVTLFVLFFAPVAFGTTVLKIDFETMSNKSDLIIEGKVKSVASSYNEKGFAIFTKVEVEVLRTIKGQAEKVVTLRVPGGTVDGKTMTIFGAPQFEKDDRVILFLIKIPDKPDALFHVSGLFQGRYMVFNQGGITYTVMDIGKGRPIFSSCEEEKVDCLGNLGLSVIPLKELVEKVNAALAPVVGNDK